MIWRRNVPQSYWNQNGWMTIIYYNLIMFLGYCWGFFFFFIPFLKLNVFLVISWKPQFRYGHIPPRLENTPELTITMPNCVTKQASVRFSQIWDLTFWDIWSNLSIPGDVEGFDKLLSDTFFRPLAVEVFRVFLGIIDAAEILHGHMTTPVPIQLQERPVNQLTTMCSGRRLEID